MLIGETPGTYRPHSFFIRMHSFADLRPSDVDPIRNAVAFHAHEYVHYLHNISTWLMRSMPLRTDRKGHLVEANLLRSAQQRTDHEHHRDADYASKLDPQRAQICSALQKSIDASLPQASSKLWHAIPVWFIGENPVVGYTARKTGVMLMFWNGQHFDEPELAPSGSFHMAQVGYNDVSEIDEAKLSRWLAKAGTSIWDMVGERNSVVAKRRTKKAKSAKRKPARAKARRKR